MNRFRNTNVIANVKLLVACGVQRGGTKGDSGGGCEERQRDRKTSGNLCRRRTCMECIT